MEVLLIVFVTTVVVLLLMWRSYRWLRRYDDSIVVKPAPSRTAESTAIVVQASVAAIAIVVAGFWYYFERRGQPHADIALEVAGAKVEEGLVLIEAQVLTKNLGRRLLKTSDWDVRLQTVAPTSLPLLDIARLAARDWRTVVKGQEVYAGQVIEWHSIKEFEGSKPRETEPGEVDAAPFDFIVGCGTKVARLVVHVKKPDVSGGWGFKIASTRTEDSSDASSQENDVKPGLWWSEQALLPVQDLCSRPVGSVVRWHGSARDESAGDVFTAGSGSR
ncbi:MAG TPA: hypothetical protein VF759_07950 [Allosphingosinicella sp.]|jgi:hypothetical protein